MTRKNTIIIAVLLNIGILAVLFATALQYTDTTTHSLEEQPLQKNSSSTIIGSMEITSPESATKTPEYNHSISYTHPSTTALGDLGITSSSDELDQALKHYNLPLNNNIISSTNPIIPAAPSAVNPGRDYNGIVSAHTNLDRLDSESELPKFREIRVKQGDTLGKIARQNSITVDELKRANKLKNINLSIGQVLRIPVTDKKVIQTQNETLAVDNRQSIASVDYYTVKPGDNPWSIANKHKLKLDDLLRLNNLDKDKARHLKPGDKLRIR
ncbi:MAG: nlpD [Chlamydiales bacterium]|jgi:LysM repeat protein|nr:nlpD [Chlamydiales bacterium]